LLACEDNRSQLGANYFDELELERLTRYLVKRRERLGHWVTLESDRNAAGGRFSQEFCVPGPETWTDADLGVMVHREMEKPVPRDKVE
jgi:hypothetical protein